MIDELLKFMSIYESSGDKGRAIAYSKAISNIKRHNRPINRVEDLDGIPLVGKSIK